MLVWQWLYLAYLGHSVRFSGEPLSFMACRRVLQILTEGTGAVQTTVRRWPLKSCDKVCMAGLGILSTIPVFSPVRGLRCAGSRRCARRLLMAARGQLHGISMIHRGISTHQRSNFGQSLPSKQISRQPSFTSSCSPTDTVASSKQVGIRELLAMPVMFALCGSAFAMSFLSTTFEVIFILYSYTAVLDGGLGFPVSRSHINSESSGA